MTSPRASALDREVAFLAGTEPFAVFEPEALRLAAFNAERRAVPGGEVLARRGEASSGGFVVVSGAVGLDPGDGRPARRAGPGATVGALALAVPMRHRADVVALEPSTLLVFRRDLLARVLETFPDTARRWRARLAATIVEQAAGLEAVRSALEAFDAGAGPARRG